MQYYIFYYYYTKKGEATGSPREIYHKSKISIKLVFYCLWNEILHIFMYQTGEGALVHFRTYTIKVICFIAYGTHDKTYYFYCINKGGGPTHQTP